MVIVTLGKFLFAFFGERWDFEGGEREADLLVHALWTNSPLSFLVFFSFFSVFVLIFFLFPLALFFSFHVVRYILCFSILSTEHDKGLFIVPAVTSVLLSCPLTAFVWSGCTCVLCDTKPLPNRGGLILSFCAPRTHFVLLCAAAFPAMMLISSLLTLRACTQRFPLKLPLLGGLSSQQNVPPKRGLSRGRK